MVLGQQQHSSIDSVLAVDHLLSMNTSTDEEATQMSKMSPIHKTAEHDISLGFRDSSIFLSPFLRSLSPHPQSTFCHNIGSDVAHVVGFRI